MADTKEFDVVRIARSDGADTGPGYWPVTAPAVTNPAKKPAKEATSAEKTPRAKPQMTRLAEDDPRFAEWRIKLGILLKQELSPNPDEGNPWYVHFPRGYWLYEKSKHLWVSGYPIKAKLFKSPQEFGVHLIWLLSTSKDYMDCCCVHCNVPNPSKQSAPEEIAVLTSNEAPAKAEKPVPKVTPVPLPTIPGQPSPKPAITTPRPQPTQQTQHPQPPQLTQLTHPIQPQQATQATQATQETQATQSIQKPTVVPTTMAKPPTSMSVAPIAAAPQQQKPQPQPLQWILKAPLLFRAGELVWYQTGNTWRLGVIAAPAGMGSYELLPIGHAMVQQQNVSKAEADLRPFHCYSVPSVDIAELKEKIFDEVPWEALFQTAGNNAVKRDLINLDASKMAASKIDSSCSLWTRRSEDANTKTVTYYGCFFGAERVEIGDCLRIKPLPGDVNTNQMSVMGLTHIFTNGDYPGVVFFRGHVYQLIKGASTAGNIVPEEKLPVALRDEIQWRNQIGAGQQWRWIIVKENVVLKEQSIRGRFYPTHRLMPLYNPFEFRNLVTSAQLREQHVYLNNRMDGGGRYIGRKRNRLETLGASVLHSGPHTARLAMEPYVMEEPFGGMPGVPENSASFAPGSIQ